MEHFVIFIALFLSGCHGFEESTIDIESKSSKTHCLKASKKVSFLGAMQATYIYITNEICLCVCPDVCPFAPVSQEPFDLGSRNFICKEAFTLLCCFHGIASRPGHFSRPEFKRSTNSGVNEAWLANKLMKKKYFRPKN